MDKEYKRICDKLGFIPCHYKSNNYNYEDDNWINPFAILSENEIDYLYRNNYLSKDYEYEKICSKLGFKIEDYNPSFSDTEDNSKPNPFAVLSLDELDYLMLYLKKAR